MFFSKQINIIYFLVKTDYTVIIFWPTWFTPSCKCSIEQCHFTPHWFVWCIFIYLHGPIGARLPQTPTWMHPCTIYGIFQRAKMQFIDFLWSKVNKLKLTCPLMFCPPPSHNYAWNTRNLHMDDSTKISQSSINEISPWWSLDLHTIIKMRIVDDDQLDMYKLKSFMGRSLSSHK